MAERVAEPAPGLGVGEAQAVIGNERIALPEADLATASDRFDRASQSPEVRLAHDGSDTWCEQLDPR